MKDKDRLLPVSEVARRLGLNVKTIRRYIYQEKLQAVRIGRYWYISEKDLKNR